MQGVVFRPVQAEHLALTVPNRECSAASEEMDLETDSESPTCEKSDAKACADKRKLSLWRDSDGVNEA